MNKRLIHVVTYCSRDKDPSTDLLPAADRYLSARIRAAREAAAKLETGFRILSGLYGLLEPDREIPAYDHLLTMDQVRDHARVIERQLRESAVEKVVFLTRTPAIDPGTESYRQAMRQACAQAGVGFEVLEINSKDPSSTELAALIRPLLGR